MCINYQINQYSRTYLHYTGRFGYRVAKISDATTNGAILEHVLRETRNFWWEVLKSERGTLPRLC